MGNLFDFWEVAFLLGFTAILVFLSFKKIKDIYARMAIIVSVSSIFLYSGLGIALPNVDNTYGTKFLISLVFFLLPFYYLFTDNRLCHLGKSSLDYFFESNVKFLKISSVIYIILIVTPLLFPRFRLFDVFTHGISIEDRYVFLNSAKNDSIGRLLSAISLFLQSFFYGYLMLLKTKEPNNKKLILLFMLPMAINIMDSCYIARSRMIYDFLLIFFFMFGIKNGKLKISRRHVGIITVIAICSIPFMYAYTFIRAGLSYETVSFNESLSLLLASEATYPEYYDHIFKSPDLQGQTPLAFILWLIFLPIPSVLWPGKPSLANDTFTFSITGLHRMDFGYSSLLPSYLGESFMYFGDWYWLFSIIVGSVFSLIIKNLNTCKYMTIFKLVLIVNMFAIGRAGATATIPLFINGTLSVFVLDYILKRKRR